MKPGERYPHKNEAAASGAILAPIAKGDTRYAKLLRYAPAVVFKDEEGSGDDLMMTPRLIGCVAILASFVAKEWPGRSLRGTESYDEQMEHSERSLHYEARAFDATVSDLDRAKLNRLADLAIAAGFDWVKHEGNHVHVSVRR